MMATLRKFALGFVVLRNGHDELTVYVMAAERWRCWLLGSCAHIYTPRADARIIEGNVTTSRTCSLSFDSQGCAYHEEHQQRVLCLQYA